MGLVKTDFEDHLGDPFFGKSICAYHNRVGELDYTWKEMMIRPFHRFVLRTRHALLYHKICGTCYVGVHVLLFLALLLGFAVVIMIGGISYAWGWLADGLCAMKQADLISNGGACNQFFKDLQFMIGLQPLPYPTCEESHILICPAVIMPLHSILWWLALLQVLGIVVLVWLKHILIEQFTMILRDTMDDIIEDRLKV